MKRAAVFTSIASVIPIVLLLSKDNNITLPAGSPSIMIDAIACEYIFSGHA
jgi:hypothetical protein